MAQKGEHQIQMADVPGSMLTGVTFCDWILLFSRSKACDEGKLITQCSTYPDMAQKLHVETAGLICTTA